MSPNPVLATKPSTRQLRVCQVIACVNERIGGPALSVTNLAQVLVNHKIDSHLFTLDYPWNGNQVPVRNIKLHSPLATPIAKHFRGFQPSASRMLQQLALTELDLIHNHGLWMFPNIYARQAALQSNRPLVISPRGMLETWALQYGQYKKWLAWKLYEQKNLSSATLFHATSPAEAASIRRLGFRQAIATIPNGVDLPDPTQCPPSTILTEAFPELADKRWLLFLSRIHQKKGVDNLLRVWQKLACRFPDWHLVLAGPDVYGYQTQMERLTQELGLQQRVTFTGMLTGVQKATALSHADLFVLPTHSENFGIAIAEALAYEIPVITTKGAPWEELNTHACGWWIDHNVSSLHAALEEGIALSPTQRQQMGQRGRRLIGTKYSWHSVGQQMSAVYDWILHGGTVPECVQLITSQV